jgi:hypothetical protein
LYQTCVASSFQIVYSSGKYLYHVF